MDVRQLRYFLAVVDHEGFNRAAEYLLIAQPSLSQAIKNLERELGVPLFHRVGRRVVLSDAGKELVGPARPGSWSGTWRRPERPSTTSRTCGAGPWRWSPCRRRASSP